MQGKYDNWSKILIAPQATSQARLYSLENRFMHTDKMRQNEYYKILENYEKLLHYI